jgi:hypothetical protein
VPATPDPVAAGRLLDNDNITSQTTPTFTGTAEPGSTVRPLMAPSCLARRWPMRRRGFSSVRRWPMVRTIIVTATDAP